MSTYILTSMFTNGFSKEISELFQQKTTERNKFAFVASEFEILHEKTDNYFRHFINMFEENDISFKDAYVVDGRMSIEEARSAVKEADVVWLSGGDTPTQFAYFQKYGLDKIIKQHNGVVIGMSAGTINMSETSICTLSCGHHEQCIYNGIGCVNFSVEPHFDINRDLEELMKLSEMYTIYGLCDESVIVCEEGNIEFYGEIYKMCNGNIELVR